MHVIYECGSGAPVPVRFLRDRATAQMIESVAPLRAALREAGEREDQEVASLLGRLGDVVRVVGSAHEAVELLERAVIVARAHGDTRLALENELRLAIAHRYAGDHEAAAEWFAELLGRPEALQAVGLLDTALQEDGKRLAELGAIDLARHRFDEALRLRRQTGTRALVHSTLEAIQALPL